MPELAAGEGSSFIRVSLFVQNCRRSYDGSSLFVQNGAVRDVTVRFSVHEVEKLVSSVEASHGIISAYWMQDEPNMQLSELKFRYCELLVLYINARAFQDSERRFEG